MNRNDIIEIGTYEIHPVADRNGDDTGAYVVVQSLTGEVVSRRYASRDEAIIAAIAMVAR